MAEYQMTLKHRERIARDTMAFSFDTNGTRYEFRAGQHADFLFLDPPLEQEGDNSRTFSLANSPHDEGLPQKLYLFYSNRDLEDTAFLEELEGLAAQNRCFTLIPTLTRLKSPGWPYENGYIDQGLLTRYLQGLDGPMYYVAGPSGMVG